MPIYADTHAHVHLHTFSHPHMYVGALAFPSWNHSRILYNYTILYLYIYVIIYTYCIQYIYNNIYIYILTLHIYGNTTPFLKMNRLIARYICSFDIRSMQPAQINRVLFLVFLEWLTSLDWLQDWCQTIFFCIALVSCTAICHNARCRGLV